MSSPASEARRIAKEYFEDSTLRCGDFRVIHSEGGVGVGDGYFEVRGSEVVVEPAEITEADKANGTIWKGDVRIECARFRKCGTSEWKERSPEAGSTLLLGRGCFWRANSSPTAHPEAQQRLGRLRGRVEHGRARHSLS